MHIMRVVYSSACLVGLGVLCPVLSCTPDTDASPPAVMSNAEGNRILQDQPGFFVPNLGQWDHAARFVHRSGPMTLFLEDRGWVLDLVERPVEPGANPHPPGHHALRGDGNVDQKIRGVALQMTFEGDAHVPEIVGEKKLPGHHNYFLGNDESSWRTGVPLYGSVRYENLYPGIDLRLREMKGVPEYDLLLEAGSDLAAVIVHVEGGQGMSIAPDGSLVIETAVGPVTQSVPRTWQVDRMGRKREVVCNFTLLGADRFGFLAPGWDGDTSLTIDPGLIWSTFLGGSGNNNYVYDICNALDVDANGVVTVTGFTSSIDFPTTSGAYDRTYNGDIFYPGDAFISRLDPSKTGTAQLIYSTYFGDSNIDIAFALAVDANGVVTVAGQTRSAQFPTSRGAYSRTLNGIEYDAFVSRLDPSKSGSAQLVYSTYLGGIAFENASALSVNAIGVVTVLGLTDSPNFPTTSGAYDTTQNGRYDAFVSRLDPSKTGAAQLVYSTFLGGIALENASALSVDTGGVVTVVGLTDSPNFPTTSGAYDTTFNGPAYGYDAFVSRLDPRRAGSAQLVYSTFMGGGSHDFAYALSVDASGVTTVAGVTYSTNFPTTRSAYDTTLNTGGDSFVSRLDPRKSRSAQLVYSTFLGGSKVDRVHALSIDANGVVTLVGSTESSNFPTTLGAYDTSYNGGSDDVFVSRLDPSKSRSAQLVYSTFLGGGSEDLGPALSVDASGIVTVAGSTSSTKFPTTSGAYNTAYNGGLFDAFVSRLDMGVALYGDLHAIPITTGGTQTLTVNAGKAHANRLYWIFGSITGTKPGVNLPGVHIPLNPDLYTNVAMGAVNTTVFTKFKGTLDSNGLATASFNVPANLPLPTGFTFHHAYVVYDASGKLYMASNAVPLTMRK